MQITFDPFSPVEREFVSSVLTTLAEQNGDASGLASVGPEAAASGEECPSSSPDSVSRECCAEAAAAPTEEPAKRKRRTKAEMEAARAAEAAGQADAASAAAPTEPADAPNPFEDAAAAPTPEPQPQPMPEPTHAPSYDTYTQEQVRAALQRYTSVKGLTAGIDLLNTFDVKRISDLNPKYYADLVAKCAV